MAREEAVSAAGMFGALVVQAAQDRELVGQAGQARQQLADIDAGDIRTDWPERPAHFGRSVGLEVERFEMARAAVGPEQDDGEIAICLRGGENLRQMRRLAGAKRAQAEPAYLQPGAAIQRPGAAVKRVGQRHPPRLILMHSKSLDKEKEADVAEGCACPS